MSEARELLRELMRTLAASYEGYYSRCHCEFCERAWDRASAYLAQPEAPADADADWLVMKLRGAMSAVISTGYGTELREAIAFIESASDGRAELRELALANLTRAHEVEAQLTAAREREARLREACALLNSMVLAGEKHSDISRAVVSAALAAHNTEGA